MNRSELLEQLVTDLDSVRKVSPLVHNITNYVVMNSTANALLALGASPVMAHAVEEVRDMVGLAAAAGGALVINIGTLSSKWIEAMEIAMQEAESLSVPVVFDPVGAGATGYRTGTCKSLIEGSPPAVIRGNGSEIMALVDDNIVTKGVDSGEDARSAEESAGKLAAAHSCITVVSGEVDIITDGSVLLRIENGHRMMSKVTGFGCTATALIGAFAAVGENPLLAAYNGMAVTGLCGEIAAARSSGPGSLQLNFYDALYNLTGEQIEERLK